MAISFLLGMVLAQRFRVVVLYPAIALALVFTISAEIARAVGGWTIVLNAATIIASLQLGYLTGIAIRHFVVVVGRAVYTPARLPAQLSYDAPYLSKPPERANYGRAQAHLRRAVVCDQRMKDGRRRPYSATPGAESALGHSTREGVALDDVQPRRGLSSDVRFFLDDMQPRNFPAGAHGQHVGSDAVRTNSENLTDGSSDPSPKMMRQIAGSFAEHEKARLVARLKGARDRERAETGKCSRRKSYAVARPEALANQLSGQRTSYGKISAELASRGPTTATGRPYVASAIQAMLGADPLHPSHAGRHGNHEGGAGALFGRGFGWKKQSARKYYW
jgi:hypothetical protein